MRKERTFNCVPQRHSATMKVMKYQKKPFHVEVEVRHIFQKEILLLDILLKYDQM